MRTRVIVAGLLTLLALGGLIWILALGNADVSIEDKGAPTIRCDSIVHPPDLSGDEGEFTLDDALRRSDTDRDGDSVAELVDACGRVRDERVWTAAVVAIPTTLLLVGAGFAARDVVRTFNARPRRPVPPRRNEQPRL